MSSFSSTVLDTNLETLWLSVTRELLRIVSMEFTVMREKGSVTLLHVEMVLCEAEQKDEIPDGIPRNDVMPEGY